MNTYKIEGMTCGGCVNAVTKALEAALEGVQVEVKLATHEVCIDGEHDPKLVAEVVGNAGFDFVGTVEKPG